MVWLAGPGGRLLLAVVVLAGAAVGWRWLVGEGVLSAQVLLAGVEDLVADVPPAWLVAGAAVAYSLLLLAMFPLTLLVVATGLLLGPGWGMAAATVGTLSSSAASYWAGLLVGRGFLERHGGPKVRSAEDWLSGRPVRTMALINLLPVAPFTLTNLLAGAFRLPFGAYLLGSALGILPGLAAVVLLGSQLGRLLVAADAGELLVGALGVLAALLVLWLLPKLAQRVGTGASR